MILSMATGITASKNPESVRNVSCWLGDLYVVVGIDEIEAQPALVPGGVAQRRW